MPRCSAALNSSNKMTDVCQQQLAVPGCFPVLQGESIAMEPMLKESADDIENLKSVAVSSGATGVALIAAGDIVVRDELAERCLEPRCENYGKSMSCPPHVGGPAHMRKLLESYEKALIFKIDVPSDLLYSSDRFELFQLLHATAADIEQAAVEMGFERAKAYAGGSCKELFCRDHAECRAIMKKGRCRNPRHARPSMSGFGIDVAALFGAAGWEMTWVMPVEEASPTKMANVSGLVLID